MDNRKRLNTSGSETSDDTPMIELAEHEKSAMNFFMLLRNITVEPVVMFSMFIITMYSMLQKKYIYARISLDYNLTASERETSCNETTANKSDPDYILQQKVSAETSKWILYLFIADFSVGLVTAVLLGSWSDKVGRKLPLMISCIGLFILMVTYVIVVNLNLPVPILLIGHFLCGLSGDVGNVLGCSFSHVADISEKSKRTLRMAVIEACIGLGGFIAALSGGIWTQKQGILQPFWFLLGISFLNVLYIGFRLESSYDGSLASNCRSLFTKQPFVHMYSVLKPQDDDKGRHINIIGYAVCFMITIIGTLGVRDILVVYEIGLPFCWNFLLVGISMAISQLGYFISVGLIRLFPSIKSEFRQVMLGAASNISACVVLAFSKSTWMIFVGLTILIFFNLPAPIIRSQITRLVSLNEVGFVLGMLSLASNVGNLLASFLFNGVFAATVGSSIPGITFLLGAGLYIIFIPLYWWVYARSYQVGYDRPSEISYNRMIEEDE